MHDADRLARRWAGSARTVVLTGAGMSTASGVPDFRSPGGRWERYQPVPIQDFLSSESARRAYWEYKGQTWEVIRNAQPNAAHEALSALARAGHVELLATQNVDGLHERSGFPLQRLVCVHGTDSAVVCIDCGRREPRAVAQKLWEAGHAVPTCACGGAWKPATISFGQSLVENDLQRSMRAAAGAELFVAAGTSLVVSPINEMFRIAAGAGAFTAILTASETPFDTSADLKLTSPLEELLPAVASAVLCARPDPTRE